MMEVQLTRGFTAIVDDEDYARVCAYNWQVSGIKPGRQYGQAGLWLGGGKQTTIMLHRFIMNALDPGVFVDHIDGNTLNNQKSNLRLVTPRQSAMNTRKRRVGTSVFKGVIRRDRKTVTNWRASIKDGRRRRAIGQFRYELSAAIAYNVSAYRAFGEYAYLNEIPCRK